METEKQWKCDRCGIYTEHVQPYNKGFLCEKCWGDIIMGWCNECEEYILPEDMENGKHKGCGETNKGYGTTFIISKNH